MASAIEPYQTVTFSRCKRPSKNAFSGFSLSEACSPGNLNKFPGFLGVLPVLTLYLHDNLLKCNGNKCLINVYTLTVVPLENSVFLKENPIHQHNLGYLLSASCSL